MEQLLCHIFADFVTQSDWQAMNKSKRTFPCLVHVLLYTSVFLFLTTSWKALLVIGGVHFILDRWPIIIRKLIWFKNHMGPYFVYVPFSKCDITGYYDNIKNEVTHQPYETSHFTQVSRKDDVRYDARLNYVTIWLYIVTDNFLHLLTNYLALKYLA